MNFIDLNLPSGTKWSEQAIKKNIFELTDEERKMLPTNTQLLELARKCLNIGANRQHYFHSLKDNSNFITIPQSERRNDETAPVILKSDECLIASIWNNKIWTSRYSLALREPTYVLFVKT